MESIDSRVKRLEQRLTSIEKFIAENFSPNKKPHQDPSLSLGRTSEPVEVSKEYHYDYSKDIKAVPTEKVQFHKVDVAAFNSAQRIVFGDDTVTTLSICSFLVLALVFAARFIMDASWLSQSGQISLAMSTGLLLIVLGYILEDRFGKTSRFFPILGQVVLYVGFYGASCFYQVIPKNIALAGILLTSMLGVFQYQKSKIDVYLIVSAMGAYIMPLYISFESESVFTNLYYIITSLIFMYVSVWLNLRTLATVGAYLSLCVCAVSEYLDNDMMNLVTFTLGHFIIYASAYVLITVRSKQNEVENKLFSYLFFPFVLLFYLVEFYYINLTESFWSPFFTGTISLLLFLFYFLSVKLNKSDKLHTTAALLLASGSVTLTHTLFYLIIPVKFRPISLIIAAFAIFKFLETLEPKKWNEYSKTLGFFLFAIIGWNYFEVIFKQFSTSAYLPIVNGIIYSVIIMYVTFVDKKLLDFKINPTHLTAVVHIMMLSIVYNFTRNHNPNIALAVVGGYFLIAAGSLFVIEKKLN